MAVFALDRGVVWSATCARCSFRANHTGGADLNPSALRHQSAAMGQQGAWACMRLAAGRQGSGRASPLERGVLHQPSGTKRFWEHSEVAGVWASQCSFEPAVIRPHAMWEPSPGSGLPIIHGASSLVRRSGNDKKGVLQSPTKAAVQGSGNKSNGRITKPQQSSVHWGMRHQPAVCSKHDERCGAASRACVAAAIKFNLSAPGTNSLGVVVWYTPNPSK